jgi:hypothetical protein
MLLVVPAVSETIRIREVELVRHIYTTQQTHSSCLLQEAEPVVACLHQEVMLKVQPLRVLERVVF